MIKCSLCGKEFEKAEAACANCPFSQGCDLLRCPNCGYEFPKDSKLLTWLGRLFKTRRNPPCPPKI